jgi:hypothetical protein
MLLVGGLFFRTIARRDFSTNIRDPVRGRVVEILQDTCGLASLKCAPARLRVGGVSVIVAFSPMVLDIRFRDLRNGGLVSPISELLLQNRRSVPGILGKMLCRPYFRSSPRPGSGEKIVLTWSCRVPGRALFFVSLCPPSCCPRSARDRSCRSGAGR